MAELKPCPFCGGTQLFVGTIAEIEMMDENHPDYRHSTEIYSVVCDYIKGGCGSSTGCSARSEEEAIEAWNRRAENEELKFTREFIHEHGLDFALASAWNRRAEDGNKQ